MRKDLKAVCYKNKQINWWKYVCSVMFRQSFIWFRLWRPPALEHINDHMYACSHFFRKGVTFWMFVSRKFPDKAQQRGVFCVKKKVQISKIGDYFFPGMGCVWGGGGFWWWGNKHACGYSLILGRFYLEGKGAGLWIFYFTPTYMFSWSYIYMITEEQNYGYFESSLNESYFMFIFHNVNLGQVKSHLHVDGQCEKTVSLYKHLTVSFIYNSLDQLYTSKMHSRIMQFWG